MVIATQGLAREYRSARQPWANTGITIGRGMTPREMMVAAGCDWTVERQRNVSYNPKSQEYEYIGEDSLFRLDNGERFGSVPTDWKETQNIEAFEFFEQFTSAGQMTMESAGILKGGRYIFALAKTNDSFELFDHDRVDNYFLFLMPHVYGASLSIGNIGMRLACWNQMPLAVSKKDNDRIVAMTHRREFDPSIAYALVKAAHSRFESYREASKFLASKRFTGETIAKYLSDLFPIQGREKLKNPEMNDNEPAPNRRQISTSAERAMNLLYTQPGNEYGTGTWWHALNTVTYVTDHVLSNTEETRLYQIWRGGERDRKLKAFVSAMEYAKAA